MPSMSIQYVSFEERLAMFIASYHHDDVGYRDSVPHLLEMIAVNTISDLPEHVRDCPQRVMGDSQFCFLYFFPEELHGAWFALGTSPPLPLSPVPPPPAHQPSSSLRTHEMKVRLAFLIDTVT